MELDWSNDECYEFLQQSLHAGFDDVDSESEASEDTDVKTCHERFGMCQNNPCRSEAQTFVRAFNRCLDENSVKTGDLLHLSMDETGESHLFFLGVRARRPMSHVLVFAHIDNAGLCEFAMDERSPDQLKIITSQQLFQQLLVNAKKMVNKVTVELCHCDIVHDSNRKPCITVHASFSGKSFLVDRMRTYETRKRHFKLPFGLKMRKKHRLQRKPRTGGRAKKKKTQQHENTSSSSRSSSGAFVASANTRHGSQPPRLDCEDEGCLEPVSKEAEQEEKEGELLIAEQEDMECKALGSEKAKLDSSGSTFFSKQVDLDSIAFALSNRSTCYSCKEKICKGDVRYSFFHSRQRPSAWVHQKCLFTLAERIGCATQVKGRLQKLLSEVPKGSSSASSSKDPSSTGDLLVTAIEHTLAQITDL